MLFKGSHWHTYKPKDTQKVWHENYNCVILRDNGLHPVCTCVFRFVTPSITTTNASANVLTARIQIVGHAFCVDNSTPELFDDLRTETIKCCGTVTQNM